MSKIFLEIVVAPSYTKEALDILCQKKICGYCGCQGVPCQGWTRYQKGTGGLLVQGLNDKMFDGELRGCDKAQTDG